MAPDRTARPLVLTVEDDQKLAALVGRMLARSGDRALVALTGGPGPEGDA